MRGEILQRKRVVRQRKKGEGGWVKNILKSQNGVTWREGPKSWNRLLKKADEALQDTGGIDSKTPRCYKHANVARRLVSWLFRIVKVIRKGRVKYTTICFHVIKFHLQILSGNCHLVDPLLCLKL